MIVLSQILFIKNSQPTKQEQLSASFLRKRKRDNDKKTNHSFKFNFQIFFPLAENKTKHPQKATKTTIHQKKPDNQLKKSKNRSFL